MNGTSPKKSISQSTLLCYVVLWAITGQFSFLPSNKRCGRLKKKKTKKIKNQLAIQFASPQTCRNSQTTTPMVVRAGADQREPVNKKPGPPGVQLLFLVCCVNTKYASLISLYRAEFGFFGIKLNCFSPRKASFQSPGKSGFHDMPGTDLERYTFEIAFVMPKVVGKRI